MTCVLRQDDADNVCISATTTQQKEYDLSVQRDVVAAAKIREEDRRIDSLEMEVDGFTQRLLALRQPLAEDLRVIIAALKVSSNLERIGDFAKNVAERVEVLARVSPLGGSIDSIARMSDVVQAMIKNVLDAYVDRDAEKADDVRLRDWEVDSMYSSLFRELLTYKPKF